VSADEDFVRQLARALRAVGLEVVLIGTGAAILQGVPLLTEDLDLLVRDTPLVRKKLDRLAKEIGGAWMDVSPLTRARRLVGLRVGIDVLFDRIAGDLGFESLRARAVRIRLGTDVIVVASLPDVIHSKRAAGRAKDRAQLPILLDTLRVKQAAAQVPPRRKRK
jgi:hypothetical protein